MIVSEKKLNREEIARLGDDIYEKSIKPSVKAEDVGKYAVIDVKTGEYEVDADELAASDRLLVRHPEAEVWLRQIGSRYARRFGQRLGAPLS